MNHAAVIFEYELFLWNVFNVIVSKYFKELPDCFSKWLHHFTFLPAMDECSISVYLCQYSLFVFLILIILLGMKWYLTVVYICISYNINVYIDDNYICVCVYLKYELYT